jgi:N-acetylmuramoyl-L-alanine amidase
MKKLQFTCLLIFLFLFTTTLAACGHEHTFGNWTVEKEPTCVESGMEVRACQCGEKETRTLSRTGHVGGLWVTTAEPTCTASGSKQHRCQLCSAVLQTQALEPLGHTEGDWIIDSEPTATREGSRHLPCVTCGVTLATESIPPKTSFLVVLDAGHGGNDPGEVVGSVYENHINLQIAHKIKAQLEAGGITVIMTREEDVSVSLEDRAQNANACDAALFVSVHCNSFDENSSVSGFEIYYHQDKQAKSLANAILSDLKATGQIKTRGVKTAEFYVLKNTTMPAVLLEMGFLTNEQERQNLCNAEYQNMLAETIASSIVQFLKKA